MQSSKRGMLKEAPSFVNGKYKKGYLSCQKWYIKGLRGWTSGAEPLYIKLSREAVSDLVRSRRPL